MSQVIVTHDRLSPERESSRKQERAIDTESFTTRWRRNDVTQMSLFLRLLGYALLPILGLWALVCGLITVTLVILRGIFRGFGRIIGGTRSLITGKIAR